MPNLPAGHTQRHAQAQLRAAVFTAIDAEERERGIALEDPRMQELYRGETGACSCVRNGCRCRV